MIEDLKAERTAQWGNKDGNPKGWDNYRASTFLEVIRAKWDRALQAQQQILDARIEIKINEAVLKYLEESKVDAPTPVLYNKIKELNSKLEKLEFDGIDSIKDAFNYTSECLKQFEQDPNLYTDNRLR